MKKNNPQTPILIREAQGTLPKVYARYGTCHLLDSLHRQTDLKIEERRERIGKERERGKKRKKLGFGSKQSLTLSLRTEFGDERAQSLEGLSDKQIEDTITGLVKK